MTETKVGFKGVVFTSLDFIPGAILSTFHVLTHVDFPRVLVGMYSETNFYR